SPGRSQPLAVRAESQAEALPRLAHEGTPFQALFYVPEFNNLGVAGESQEVSVGAEGDHTDRMQLITDAMQYFPGPRVPNLDLPKEGVQLADGLDASGSDTLTVWAKRHSGALRIAGNFTRAQRGPAERIQMMPFPMSKAGWAFVK